MTTKTKSVRKRWTGKSPSAKARAAKKSGNLSVWQLNSLSKATLLKIAKKKGRKFPKGTKVTKQFLIKQIHPVSMSCSIAAKELRTSRTSMAGRVLNKC